MNKPEELDSELLVSVEGYNGKIGDIYNNLGISTNLKRIYLRNLIYEIEEAQIAESIKKVGEVYLNQDDSNYFLNKI